MTTRRRGHTTQIISEEEYQSIRGRTATPRATKKMNISEAAVDVFEVVAESIIIDPQTNDEVGLEAGEKIKILDEDCPHTDIMYRVKDVTVKYLTPLTLREGTPIAVLPKNYKELINDAAAAAGSGRDDA